MWMFATKHTQHMWIWPAFFFFFYFIVSVLVVDHTENNGYFSLESFSSQFYSILWLFVSPKKKRCFHTIWHALIAKLRAWEFHVLLINSYLFSNMIMMNMTWWYRIYKIAKLPYIFLKYYLIHDNGTFAACTLNSKFNSNYIKFLLCYSSMLWQSYYLIIYHTNFLSLWTILLEIFINFHLFIHMETLIFHLRQEYKCQLRLLFNLKVLINHHKKKENSLPQIFLNLGEKNA